jgi:hypothetical protein
LVPQPGTGGRQIGIITAVKLEQDNQPGTRDLFGDPRGCSLESRAPPEIVGQIDNPVLEAIRRFSWRAVDRVCDWFVVLRLSMHERIFGSQSPRPAELEREDNRQD